MYRINNYTCELFFFLNVFALGGSPTPHPFPPDLILYVNLVAMGPVHLSPVTWPQALRYWYSLTPLMHIVAQLHPIDFVRHVTGNDKDYLRLIPRVVW
jgi:hypothetical protein